MSQQQSPYQILGVAQDADTDTIKKAKRKLIRQFHPDRYKGDDAEEKSAAINGAWDILSDEKKRDVYDNYGYDGLDRLADGEDPAGQSGGNGGAWNMDTARAEFGYEEEGLSDDELFGDDLNARVERRDTSDVLNNAKRSNNPFGNDDLSVDDLLAEARGEKKQKKPKKEKPPKSSSSSSTIDDITGKASDMFSRIRNKAEKTFSHQDDDAPAADTATAQPAMAERLRDVMQELTETNGKLSSMSLKAVLAELSDIADNLDNPAGPQSKKTSGYTR